MKVIDNNSESYNSLLLQSNSVSFAFFGMCAY